MDRRTIRLLALAAVGVLAVALAAATLGASVPDDAGSVPAGGDGGSVDGRAGGVLAPLGDRVDRPAWLSVAIRGLLALVAVSVLVALLSTRPRETVGLLLALGALAAVWFLLVAPGGGDAPFSPARVTDGVPFATGDGGGETTAPWSLPAAFLLLLVLLGGFVLAAAVRGAPDRRPRDRPLEVDETPEAAAVGRAAGRAADRIVDAGADASPDNEVYRAWRDMAAPLDVGAPATSTPGEFAAAAVGAGLDPDDVRELTDLFEAVRYGGAEPTAERERRALSVLRRIESAYAGDGS